MPCSGATMPRAIRVFVAFAAIATLAVLLTRPATFGGAAALLMLVCVAALVWAASPLLTLLVGEHFDEDEVLYYRGFRVDIDPDLPPGRLEARDRSGRLLGAIQHRPFNHEED